MIATIRRPQCVPLTGKSSLRLAVAAGIAAALALPASAQDNADRDHGAALAQSWCIACHVIDNRESGPAFATTPTFPELSRRLGATPQAIRAQLSASHTLMPKMALSERDKDDLIAYLLSLRYRAD